ncbi:MAG TPA: sigma-70 family RNA polymerase sigma factor [Anaerolineales bacterium]|nr:sigma-70 family RNA polymerase sigma factor [Anaerolineales bacterium]
MSDSKSELDGLRDLNSEVISSIHNRYFPEVFRYARYRLGDETLAEDIAGEAFTRLLESVNAGRGPHTNLHGWLMSTTSNLINDHLRHAYAHPTETLHEDLELYADGPSPAQHLEQSDRNQLIHNALTALTFEQQQVIALRFGGGYSLEETATLMDKNVNAIKALQYRAIVALRRGFGKELL